MKLLHPTDFSETAEHAQQLTVKLAHAMGGEIILLHVAVETPLYREGVRERRAIRQVYEAARKWAASALEERVAAIREHGLACRSVLKPGAPHEEIVKTAAEEGADFIVIGTHGRGGVERFFVGSVTDRVVRTASCPVVTVRTPGS